MSAEKPGRKTEPASKSLFDRGKRPETAEPPRAGRRLVWWKAAVVLGLLAGVVVAILARGGPPEPNTQAFPPETVLATVNGEPITLADLDRALADLPADYRSDYGRRKREFLDELIARKILIQEARKKKISETESFRAALGGNEDDPDHQEHVLIDLLLREEVLDKVQVSDADLRDFYEKHKDQLPGRPSFEEARDMIRPSVREQKEYQALETYLARLKQEARITRNQAWIRAQEERAAQNPLDRALRSGKPVLADFGRGTCIPCKMMKPILDRLAEELKGRVHVLILDTGEYGYLARRHRIRMIPTQIFFDAKGQEVFRHEGFMSRDDILSRLKALEMVPR